MNSNYFDFIPFFSAKYKEQREIHVQIKIGLVLDCNVS